MGYPRGMSMIRYTRISIYVCFLGQFFIISKKKIVMGKKDCCAEFGCNSERPFADKYILKFSFCLFLEVSMF